MGTEDATVVTSSQPDGASDEKKVVDGDTEVLLAEPLITADSYTMQSFHSIEGFDNADDYIRKFGQWILTQDIQANTTTHVFVAIQKAEKAGFQGLKDRIKTYKKDAAQTHEGKEMTGWVLGLYLCYLDLPAPKDEEEVPHDGGEKTFVEEEPTDAPKLTEETFLEVVEYIKSRQPYIDALRSVWSQHLTKSPRDVRISLDRLAHTLSDYIDGLVTIFGASSRLEIVADILELPWTPEHQEKHMRKRNPFDELKPHEAKLREVHGLLSRESGTDGNSDFERIFDGAQVEWPRSQNWKFREDCEYV